MNKFILALLVITYTLCSCTKDHTVENKEDASPIKVNINLKTAKATTKSVDANSIDEDNVINNLIVFVVRADNSFDVNPIYFSASDLIGGVSVPQISATTKATSIYVITNTGSLSNGPFKDVSNLEQLSKVALSLDGNPNNESQCRSQNVWMSGNNILLAGGLDSDGIPLRNTTIKLGYVPAKVHVILVNEMSNYNSGNVILDGVAVINGGHWTRFTMENGSYKPNRQDLPNNVPFFYNGIKLNTTDYTDRPATGDYVESNLYNWAPSSFFPMLPSVSIPTTAMPLAKEGFYIFPTITENNTYLTVYGRYKTGGEAHTLTSPNLFWSFCFGGNDGLAEALASGEKCIVKITLKGNATTGGGGNPDPTEEPSKSFVDITIQSAEWTPIIIDKIIE